MNFPVTADQLHPLVIKFEDPVYQGQVIEMDFSYTDELGGHDLTGTLWAFHLRKKGDAGIPIISKSTAEFTFPIDPTALPIPLAKLRISSAETAALSAKVNYEFEVWLTVASNRPFVAGTGLVVLKAPIAAPNYVPVQ